MGTSNDYKNLYTRVSLCVCVQIKVNFKRFLIKRTMSAPFPSPAFHKGTVDWNFIAKERFRKWNEVSVFLRFWNHWNRIFAMTLNWIESIVWSFTILFHVSWIEPISNLLSAALELLNYVLSFQYLHESMVISIRWFFRSV